MPLVYVVIPAQNEEQSIGKVINDIPPDFIEEIIVVDNGSTDNTANEVLRCGATLLQEPILGYGAACLKGIEYLENKLKKGKDEIVVFIDGDYSDYPEQITKVVEPVTKNNFDMVIGSRALGNKAKNSMMPQQIFGNWLATFLIRVLYNARFTDLGPFRAIKYTSLLALGMKDTNYGWTVEMQLKAAKQKLKFCEVPVDYRVRIGESKVSGTIKGSVMAGYKILYTIFKYM